MSKYYVLLLGSLAAYGAYSTDNIESTDEATPMPQLSTITLDSHETQPYWLDKNIIHNFIISSNGSIFTQASMSSLGQSNAITITNAQKNISNYGKIISQIAHTGHKGPSKIEYAKGYSIYIDNGSIKDNSLMDNYGDVIFRMNVEKEGTAANQNIDIKYSGNGAYININKNKGIILSDIDMIAGEAYSANGRAQASAVSIWTGIGVYGYINHNDGLIMSDFVFKGNKAKSTLHKNTNKIYCNYTDVCVPLRTDYSGNSVVGHVKNNKGYIFTLVDAAAGRAENNLAGSIATAEVIFRESGNGVLGNVDENKGVIYTNAQIKGGHASAVDHIGGTYHVYIRGSNNGVYGNVANNQGLIGTNITAIVEDTDVPKASAYIEDRLSSNGVYGGVKHNSGTIRGFVDYKPGKKLGQTNPIYSHYSGNGIAFKNLASVNTVNEGVVAGKRSAISINGGKFDGGKFHNYGLLIGQEIFSRTSSSGLDFTPVNLSGAQNYGTYLHINSEGVVQKITQAQPASYNGKTSVQIPLVGKTDAYKIFDNPQNNLHNKIINGVGTASGVVTLKNYLGDFQINQSVINAYHTALSYQNARIISLKDTIVNGGGLEGAEKVIIGDDTANGLVAEGNTVINGNVSLGGNNDIFVFDHHNAEINGRMDLGEGTKDTFALYEFYGSGNDFLPIIKKEVFHDRANHILGDKVVGQEFLGLQKGRIELQRPGDYTDYGLYIGNEATATFTANQNYTLKGLLNFGKISLVDEKTSDNLTILEDAYLSGIIEKDTSFIHEESDKISILGQLSGNAKIRIFGTGDGRPSEDVKVLITAPNDDNRLDEAFTFADEQRYQNLPNKGRFNGSPHPWYLLTEANSWVLSPFYQEETGGGDGSTDGGDIDGDLGNIGGIIDGGGGSTDGGNTGGGNSGGGNSGGGSTGGGNTGGGSTGGGSTGSNVGGDKIELLAEIPGYISLMNLAQEIAQNDIGILYSRLSKVRKERNFKTYTPISPIGSWFRVGGNKFSFDEGQIFDLSGHYESFDGGIDKLWSLPRQWATVVGMSAGYKTGDFKTKAGANEDYITTANARIRTEALAFGLYGSLFNQGGSFANLTAKYIDYKAHIDAAGLQSSLKGQMFVGAIAGGHKFDFKKNWGLEPLAQLDFGYIHWQDFYDGFNDISFDNQYYTSARLGMRLENHKKLPHSFLLESWLYAGVAENISHESHLHVSYDEFLINDYGLKSEFEAGLTLKKGQNIEFYLEGGYATDFSKYKALRGDAALRVFW